MPFHFENSIEKVYAYDVTFFLIIKQKANMGNNNEIKKLMYKIISLILYFPH